MGSHVQRVQQQLGQGLQVGSAQGQGGHVGLQTMQHGNATQQQAGLPRPLPPGPPPGPQGFQQMRQGGPGQLKERARAKHVAAEEQLGAKISQLLLCYN